MKAAFITETGSAEKIKYDELPTPEPGGSQVRVKVEAVSVNPIDTYIRGGLVPGELPSPYIIGCDVAGTIDKPGPEVKRFQAGDRVWGSNQGLLGRQGTFAEYVVVDEAWLYPAPSDVSSQDAAAIALVGITAHLGLVREAKLKSGEVVFVNGGSGAVGSTVIQMARAIGARVIASTGSKEKAEVCKALGAEAVINYKSQKVDEELKKAAPEGVNVWWETTREPDFDLAVGALAERGRMILMAGRDARPVFPVGPFYVKECSLHGFVMFKADAEEQRACARDINQWLSEGKLKPRIGKVLPLSEAAAAHKLQEDNTLHNAGTLSGKIVLKP